MARYVQVRVELSREAAGIIIITGLIRGPQRGARGEDRRSLDDNRERERERELSLSLPQTAHSLPLHEIKFCRSPETRRKN